MGDVFFVLPPFIDCVHLLFECLFCVCCHFDGNPSWWLTLCVRLMSFVGFIWKRFRANELCCGHAGLTDPHVVSHSPLQG